MACAQSRDVGRIKNQMGDVVMWGPSSAPLIEIEWTSICQNLGLALLLLWFRRPCRVGKARISCVDFWERFHWFVNRQTTALKFTRARELLGQQINGLTTHPRPNCVSRQPRSGQLPKPPQFHLNRLEIWVRARRQLSSPQPATPNCLFPLSSSDANKDLSELR